MNEPVDIKFRINNDELEQQSRKAVDSILDVGKSSATSVEDVTATLNRLKSQQKELGQIINDASKWGAPPKALTDEYNKIAKEIQEAEARINSYKNTTDTAGQSQVSFRTQLRQAREELIRMEQAGERGTQAFAKQQQLVGDLTHAMNHASMQARVLANDESAFQGVISGLSGMAGGFSAATGAVSLFAGENENLQKIMVKVQSLMAVTIGLQQINQTLGKDSAFRLKTVAKATELWTAATNKLTVALGGSRIAAQALMGALTLGLSVAIGFAVDWLMKYIDKQRKASEEQEKFAKAVSENSSQSIADFEKLRKSYEKVGDTIDAKTDFIIQHQEEFKKLGVEINNVTDADNLFIKGAEEFRASIIMRAQAMAAMELAAEKYKSYMEKMLAAENREQSPNWKDNLLGSNDFFSRNGQRTVLNSRAVSEADKKRQEAEKDKADADKLINQHISFTEQATELVIQANGKSIENIAKGTKEWWERYKKMQEEALSKLTDKDVGSAEWKRLAAERDKATLALKAWETKSSRSRNAERDAQRKSDAERKLNEMLRGMALEKQQFDIDMRQKEIDLMEDSFAKRSAQLKLNNDKELQTAREFAEKKLKQQQELEKQQYVGTHGNDLGFKPTTTTIAQLPEEVQGQIKQMYDAAKAEFDRGNELLGRDLEDFMQEQRMRMASSLEQQLNDIEKYYKDRIRQAEGNETLIAQLIKDKQKEISEANNRYLLDRLDAEEEIAKKRIDVSNKFYLFDSDREKEQLKVSKEYTEKRLKLLEEMQKENPKDKGLADEIEKAKLSLKGFANELRKLDIKKLQELAGYFSQLAPAIGDLLGALTGDEDLSKLAGWLSDAAQGAADLAAGIASGNPQSIVNGVQKLIGVVTNVINANKEANKKIAEFRDNLVQMAVEYSIALISALKDVKSVNDSIFSTDTTNALTKGMESYNAAIAKQDELMDKLGETTVKTGVKKKKFLGITYGTKDVYDNLLKTYPDLINKDGELNRELADTLLKSGNLSKEAKNAIDNIISAEDAAKSAMDTVNGILTNVAGSIGDDLRNALVDAFTNGTDAAEAFGQSVSKIMEDLISNKIFNAVFGQMLSDLEEEMKQSYSAGGDQDITDEITDFFKNYNQNVDEFNKALEAAKEQAAKSGIDIFKPGEQSAKQSAETGGIKAVSQDSFDIWLGQFTAIRIHTSNIYDAMIKDNAIMNNTFSRIEENTKVSADCLKEIRDFSKKWTNEGMKIA